MSVIETLMATETITVCAWRQRRRGGGAGMVAKSRRRGPVLEGGQVRGLLSERDVANRVVAAGRDPQRTLVAEVATRDVVTIDAAAPLRNVLETFRARGFRRSAGDPRRPGWSASSRPATSSPSSSRASSGTSSARATTGSLAEGADPYDHFGGSYGK